MPIAAALPENIQRILDLGAGTGLELTAVFERFPNVRVTAIDVSEDMLAILRRRPFADRVEIRCADFFEAGFQSAHAEPIPDTLYTLLTAQKP